MFRRFVSLLLILGSMALIVYANPFGLPETVSPTLVLGFMLLAAYCIGFILEQKGLPRITGYIFAGLFLGPYFLKFYMNFFKQNPYTFLFILLYIKHLKMSIE